MELEIVLKAVVREEAGVPLAGPVSPDVTTSTHAHDKAQKMSHQQPALRHKDAVMMPGAVSLRIGSCKLPEGGCREAP